LAHNQKIASSTLVGATNLAGLVYVDCASVFQAEEAVAIQQSAPIFKGLVAQLGERLSCTQEAAGAEPVWSTNFMKCNQCDKTAIYGPCCLEHVPKTYDKLGNQIWPYVQYCSIHRCRKD
jgi:hypothetical protein